MLKNEGGALNEDSVELAEFAPGGCLAGPNGVRNPTPVGERLSEEPPGSFVPSAVPGPEPLFVTVIEPTSRVSGTFTVAYGSAITLTHGPAGVSLTVSEPSGKPLAFSLTGD